MAEKLAEVPPDGTDRLAGTVKLELLLESEIENADPAATVRVTLQVRMAGGNTLDETQLSPLSAGVGAWGLTPIEPLVAVVVSALPAGEAANTAVGCIGMVPDEFGINWKVAVATTPSPITVLFIP